MPGNDSIKTPLYDVHRERGAKLVDFGGFLLPVQYDGAIVEHHAIRQKAGLFDVSHMGQLMLSGPDAAQCLSHLVTADLGKLQDGAAVYTLFCNPDGGIIADLIVYRDSASAFFLCVNATRTAVDYEHCVEHSAGQDCAVEDVSSSYALIALQGPKAREILASISSSAFDSLKPFQFGIGTVGAATDVRVACTGYTGEDGFELYCRPDDAKPLWCALEKAGETAGIRCCGLAARDTLRLEMKYSLYGNDIDLDHNPFEAGLGWAVKLGSAPFIGSDALSEIKANKPARRLVGFEITGRGIARPGYPLVSPEGAKIGAVTSGTHSPSLGHAIGMGYVPTSMAKSGTNLNVEIRGKLVPAVVVKTPFFKRDQ